MSRRCEAKLKQSHRYRDGIATSLAFLATTYGIFLFFSFSVFAEDTPQETKLATAQEFEQLQKNISTTSPSFQRAPLSSMEKEVIAYQMAIYLVGELRNHYRGKIAEAEMLDWTPLLDTFTRRISTGRDMSDVGLTQDVFGKIVLLEGLLKKAQEDLFKLSRFNRDAYLSSVWGHLTENGMAELERIGLELYHLLPELASNYSQAFSGPERVWTHELVTHEPSGSSTSRVRVVHIDRSLGNITLQRDMFKSLMMHYADRILALVDVVRSMPTMNFYVISPGDNAYVELKEVTFSPWNVFNQYGREASHNRLIRNVERYASLSARLLKYKELLRYKGWKGYLKNIFKAQEGEVGVVGRDPRSIVAEAAGRVMQRENLDRMTGEVRGDEEEVARESKKGPRSWLKEARGRIAKRFGLRR